MKRDHDGRFYGRRVNLEGVQRLPAVAVRLAIEDPLSRPYVFAWVGNGESYIARVALGNWPPVPFPAGPMVDARFCGEPNLPQRYIRTLYRPLPRGIGRELLLICPDCIRPKRFLYARRTGWKCRNCAELSFASEGGALQPAGFARGDGEEPFPRPQPWNPYVFGDLKEATRFVTEESAARAC